MDEIKVPTSMGVRMSLTDIDMSLVVSVGRQPRRGEKAKGKVLGIVVENISVDDDKKTADAGEEWVAQAGILS